MRRPPDERGLFSLLGVDASAPWEEVRRAFREAMRANHPDLHGGDAEAEMRVRALNAAWESINTPSKWAAYLLQPPSEENGGAARVSGAATSPSLGRLHVRRQQRGSSGQLQWKIELDGEVAGTVGNGGVSVLEATPGRHALRVFYGSRSSLPLPIDLHRGQELLLGCRQLESLRLSLFSPGRSLVLEQIGSRRFA